MSRRADWRRAISAATFPVGMRPIKATLLSLPIDADGRLCAWRDDIATTTGLPVRTVDRHLARACDAGWLTHDVQGGHGRRGTYTVSIPTAEVVRHKWHANPEVVRQRKLRATRRVINLVQRQSQNDSAVHLITGRRR